ncbi:MAG: SAM-dependent methyltransferase [Gemmatimonadaceae bacterium]|nr:SAM-dependent methyltransferase [Gemmatimonadaceae bacterium]
MLGRVYEYFLSEFASAEGKKGGEFLHPSSASGCSRAPCPIRRAMMFTPRALGRLN